MPALCKLCLLYTSYLVVRRVINPIIPLSFIGTVFALTAVAGANPLQQILSGGVMLGAIFMATDYSTSPMTNGGKLIFGIGCGLITVLIRLFGSSAEGVSYSIILMNIPVSYTHLAHGQAGAGGVCGHRHRADRGGTGLGRPRQRLGQGERR